MNPRLLFFGSLALSLAATSAASETFGGWSVGLSEEGTPFMFSINESGTVFGKYCDLGVGGCFWLLASNTPCVEEAKAPAIINSGDGATATSVTCISPRVSGDKKIYRAVFDDPSALDHIVSKSNKISAALPLEGDSFRILRFNTEAAPRALARFGELVVQQHKKQTKSTKDLTL